MIAVIFEVQPKPERRDDYLAHAASLRPALEAIDGFISVERFASGQTEGKVLSLSLWRDEEAVVRWRTHGGHRAVQAIGRSEIFQFYRLRVGMLDAVEADAEAKYATIGETIAEAGGSLDQDLFESLSVSGKFLRLASWRGERDARRWARAAAGEGRRVVQVIRDYGMFDRKEAPQFYPPVPRRGA